ncbi:alpha/beta hydrolase [Erythrobacter longus]|uniref:Alpha/beta hydrolase n=1 Tax=Erythrobacter longus TaxID=1044 RepID=A0A074MBL6_ERYLO|nr:alpha/beta hydrolase [Erythrobacter longus]KEO89243.1 alpha/beta hydrolase [Erythrobacter longus]
MRQTKNPITRHIKAGDITLAYHEWPSENEAAPTLLIAHATGFHGRCYDAIAAHFPDARVIAVDMHGHGQSTGEPLSEWQIVVDELTDLIDHLELSGAVAMGHSMGGHAVLRAAAKRPDAFRSLVLFDPVILSPEFYQVEVPGFAPGQMHPAAKRKRDFASVEEMIERFQTRDPYNLFRPDVFENYCRCGLTPVEDGGFELSCSPEMEAGMYMSSLSGAPALDAATKVATPTTVVRAMQLEERDFKGSPTWPGLAASMPNGIDMNRPDMTHFHPFQDPDDAARIIREAMNA